MISHKKVIIQITKRFIMDKPLVRVMKTFIIRYDVTFLVKLFVVINLEVIRYNYGVISLSANHQQFVNVNT